MDIYEIIGKLLGAVVVAILAYLLPKIKAWLTANTDDATEASIQRMVTAFCRAAEQLFKANNPTGEKRNQFVREQLAALGIEVTDAVINMVEGAVWEINNRNKQVQVQAKALDDDGNA